ncbi:MAG TPA: cyanophycin synthetase, partial [Acidimicrobiia bacterium]|nr:cyanophycin synthetase [Acidimicrobiia bacterium]
DVAAADVVVDRDGGRFTIVEPDGSRTPVHTPLLGTLNVANALAAAVTARVAGFDLRAVVEGLAAAPTVAGRLEPVTAGQPFEVLVDYAHTPDALAAALVAARQLAGARRVIVVFGAGGDRDAEKRPLMGRAAAEHADLVIVTNDNPRSEDPAAIADAVLAGTADGPAATRRQLDRRAAIRDGLDAAQPGDVVLIAGKGHETEQRYGDRTIQFDDRAVVGEELGSRQWN